MLIFVTKDDEGSLRAASTKNPIECMEIIDKSSHLGSIIDEKGIEKEDMINFEDFLTQLVSHGVAELINVTE